MVMARGSSHRVVAPLVTLPWSGSWAKSCAGVPNVTPAEPVSGLALGGLTRSLSSKSKPSAGAVLTRKIEIAHG
jgi:hypothetical protein